MVSPEADFDNLSSEEKARIVRRVRRVTKDAIRSALAETGDDGRILSDPTEPATVDPVDWLGEWIDLEDADLPEYVKNLVTLQSCGIDSEQAMVHPPEIAEDGSIVKYPSFLVPLAGLEYEAQDGLDDAILRAMGHDPSDRPDASAS